MDSLFLMQRFDPSLDENDVGKDEENKKDILKNRLKRKHSESVPDETKEGKENQEKDAPSKKKKKKNKKKQNTDNIEGFTILGDQTDKTVKKVTRVLPYWLLHPDIVTVDLHASPLAVQDMPGLDQSLIDKLKKENISNFFPVQRQVIPHLLDFAPKFRPSDVCVSAPTGSGKTLAFVLPIVQALKNRMVPRVRCLAVLPTQELASQVFSVFSSYCEGTKLRVKLLTGGDSVVGESGLVRTGVCGMIHQLYDILVVTPGRLTHTIKECPNLDLTYLRYLVIDEADRMMESIAQDWLNILEAAVYQGHRKRPGQLTVKTAFTPSIPLQKLLFSATLSHDPEQLEQLNLFEPKLYRCVVPVEGASENAQAQSLPTSLKQLFTTVKQADKPLVLHHLLTSLKLEKVLVFTHNNETVHRLALVLENLGHKVGELSSQVIGRKKVLNNLSKGVFKVVVCSDVVARGIDLEDLDGVISYDVPAFVKTYIHRVGRTARAGKTGTAITLCEEKQSKSFLKMLKDGNITGAVENDVTENQLDEYREAYESSLENVKEQLQQEKTSNLNPNNKQQKKNKFFRKKK